MVGIRKDEDIVCALVKARGAKARQGVASLITKLTNNNPKPPNVHFYSHIKSPDASGINDVRKGAEQYGRRFYNCHFILRYRKEVQR